MGSGKAAGLLPAMGLERRVNGKRRLSGVEEGGIVGHGEREVEGWRNGEMRVFKSATLTKMTRQPLFESIAGMTQYVGGGGNMQRFFDPVG